MAMALISGDAKTSAKEEVVVIPGYLAAFFNKISSVVFCFHESEQCLVVIIKVQGKK